tara:strand:- start:585 stop:1808 length:1224 start_codon:yes stop_codon:yes gene_type:complete
MADNLELSQNSFSIQDTMEMGAGNQELLQGLFAPEVSPEDVQPIIAEANPAEPAKKPDVPKGKEITPVEDEDSDEKKAQSLISNFLGDNSEDDNQEEVITTTVKTTVAPETPVEENNTQFTALSNDLFKLGVFVKEEGEEDVTINTPEELLERFNSEKRKGASEIVENFIGRFGQDYQDAFDAIFVKGADPKEYFGVYNQVVDLSEMDLTQEANQIAVMRRALTDQGVEPEDITTEIERLQNYGDLETVSAKYHKVLVKKDAQRLQEIQAKGEQEQLQKQQIKTTYIQNVQNILEEKMKTKEFDGIPLNPKIANELHDFLLVDKWKTPQGETLSDFDRAILDLKRPENHTAKVKLALIMKLLEKDPTLSTIQNKGVTNKTNQLFSEVARQTTKTKTTNTEPPKSWFQ